MTWPCPASGWTGPVRTFCSPCSSAWWPCTWSRRWPKPGENGRALQVLFPVGGGALDLPVPDPAGHPGGTGYDRHVLPSGAPPVAGHSGGRPGPCHHPRLPQRPADPLPPPGTQHVPPSGSITPPTPSSSWSSASLAISFCRLSISFLVCCKIASLICEREKTQISVSSPAVFHFEGGCCQNDIPIFLSIAPDGAHTKGWPYSSGVSSSVGSSGKSSSAGVSRVVPPAALPPSAFPQVVPPAILPPLAFPVPPAGLLPLALPSPPGA